MKKPSFTQIKNHLLDLFFPKFCVGCKKEGNWLCENCKEDMIAVISQVCPECGRLSLKGKYCKKCQKGKYLKGIIAALYYKEGPTKEIIHNIKYNSVIELAPVLGISMAEVLKNNLVKKDALITFAPLHSKRLAQRGFNQAELLAKIIAKESKLKLINLLKKRKNTKQQVELKGNSRRKNLAGVFNFSGGPATAGLANIKGKTIIIIDDVTTTGATLNECAKVLKEAGAKEVWGLVAARG